MAKQNTHSSDKASNFDFNDMVSNWLGYISSIDRTNVAENVYVRGSLNIYKKLSGTLAVRPGEKRQGIANSTIAACPSEYVWNTSWGAIFTLVVSNATLWVVSNKLWYPLQVGLTETRYVFDSWWDNTEKKQDVIFVHGTAEIDMWPGGFGLVSSTTSNTIILDRTVIASQLPSSGSVIVNGTTYTYSGSSGSTLTGVSGDPTGEAIGSGVLQPIVVTSDPTSSGFAPDYIKVINNQAYLGSYTSNITYVSNETDYTDYVVPNPRVAGSPEFIVLDGTGKGIGIRQGNAVIGFGSSGFAVISFNDVTVGTTLTNVTTVTIKPVAVLQAPLAHEFIDNVGDNLIYMSQDQQVREFGDFNDAFVAVYPSLSQEVATELMEENFSGGGLRCIGEYIYITAPDSGKTYLRQERTRVDPNGTVVSEKLWHAPFIWNATRIDVINGVIVVFSNANPQIYEVWDTGQYHDDSPSNEPLPYSCVLALGYRGSGRRQGLWSFDKNFTEGYITPGTTLNLQVNYNYQGATSTINAIINSADQPGYIFQTALASLGDNSLGDEPLGNGGIIDTGDDPNTLPKFKVINSLGLTNCFEWQPIFSSDTVDSQWEILATATNATIEEDEQAIFIINKKSISIV